jgi:poly-gamma-glutamate synthesis protein (capsule biosynthesis protein)
VDVVHGHSAHVIQGVETYGNGFILYDTGNFLDDYGYWPYLRLVQSFAFVVEYRNSRPKRLDLFPVSIREGQASLAKGHEFRKIVRRMTRRSARLGTDLRQTAAGLSLDAAQSGNGAFSFEPRSAKFAPGCAIHRHPTLEAV